MNVHAYTVFIPDLSRILSRILSPIKKNYFGYFDEKGNVKQREGVFWQSKDGYFHEKS